MAEKKVAALGLICIILAVALSGTVMMLSQKETEVQIKTEHISEIETEKGTLETQMANLQAETTSLGNEVDALEAQVSSLQTEASTLETEKSSLETQVSSLQTEKATLETQVTSLQSETTTLQNDVTTREAQISSLQSDVADLEIEVTQSYISGYNEGESDGYQVGYDEGYTQGIEYLTQTGNYLRDPTYDEAIAFIASDTTNENPYIMPIYVCYDFTADFNENAQEAGYRCGFVYIEYSGSAHAIACFNTTDQGLIYVEPQNDQIVTISVGQIYLGDVIIDMGIIW